MLPTLCASCKWFDDGKCPAFPKGIPEDIMVWGADHRSVLPQQEGTTVHVLQDGKEQAFEDWVFTYVLAPE